MPEAADRLRLVSGLLVLALPGAVWAGAAYEELLVGCDPLTCELGDRRRGWFLGILVTAPLIPLGAALMTGGLRRRGALAALLKLVCLLGAASFGLLGVLMLAASTGLTDGGDGAMPGWIPVGLFCLGIGGWLLVVRRRLLRRYPSGSWPRSDRSTSAG